MENNNFENQPAEPVIVNETGAVTEKENFFVALYKKCLVLFKKVLALPKALLISVGSAILATIILLCVLVPVLTNNYRTPVKNMEKIYNTKSFNTQLEYYYVQDDIAGKEAEAIFKILKKSDEFKDSIEEMEESFEEDIDDKKDEYGKNYKFKIKITDKEKLDKSELRDYKNTLKDRGDRMKDALEEYEDYDSDDWEDIADEMEISKSSAKKCIKQLEKAAKKYKKIKVTAGYKLDIEITVKGSELDEPEEISETTVYVYKVNGKWISGKTSSFFYMF